MPLATNDSSRERERERESSAARVSSRSNYGYSTALDATLTRTRRPLAASCAQVCGAREQLRTLRLRLHSTRSVDRSLSQSLARVRRAHGGQQCATSLLWVSQCAARCASREDALHWRQVETLGDVRPQCVPLSAMAASNTRSVSLSTLLRTSYAFVCSSLHSSTLVHSY